jgi:hypothetical protein
MKKFENFQKYFQNNFKTLVSIPLNSSPTQLTFIYTLLRDVDLNAIKKMYFTQRNEMK